MAKFKCKKFVFLIFFVLSLNFLFSIIPFFNPSISYYSYASLDDINYINENKLMGDFYSLSLDKNCVYADNNLLKVNVKFLNLITINSFYVKTVEESVYAGGNAVGVYLNTKGVMLMGSNSIITKNGLVNTLENSDLQVGDVIMKLNDEVIYNIDDISEIINREENKGNSVKITYLRNNKEYETSLMPALDEQSGEYKLGIWVKNDASGVGTLTFITKEGEFGALGHSINVSGTKSAYNIAGGKLYACNIIGVNKGQKGRAGELKGLFLQGKNIQGEITQNIQTGIYGKIGENSSLLEDAKTREYKIGGRFSARPGKAKILSCVSGNEVKEYDIEIVKTNYQNSSKEKSMVIKVTDKELLDKTGGIVQGMSGSPIVQNGKIVGAVTHVFINDSSKGFGLYLDWMID